MIKNYAIVILLLISIVGGVILYSTIQSNKSLKEN